MIRLGFLDRCGPREYRAWKLQPFSGLPGGPRKWPG